MLPKKMDLQFFAKESNASKRTVSDLISSSTKGNATKGRSTQYIKVGDYQQAVDDFYSLNPKDIKEMSGSKKGYVGKLEDGRTINVRYESSEGSPTIEIQKGKNRIKFRYKEK